MDVFETKLSRAWGVPTSKLRLPSSPLALHQWVSPKAMASTGMLNWSEWFPGMAAQAAALQDLLMAPSHLGRFLVWKRSAPSSTAAIPACERVDGGEVRVRLLADLLEDVTVSQMLRNETRDEARLRVFQSRTALEARLRAATEVHVHKRSESVQAVALVFDRTELSAGGLLSTPARGASRLADIERATGATRIVVVETLLVNRCTTDHVTAQLLEHLERTHPDALLVMPVPPVLSALSTYSSLGYSWAGEPGGNLLVEVVLRLEEAVRLWHSGHPAFTYADPYIEATRVRLSLVTHSATASKERIQEETSSFAHWVDDYEHLGFQSAPRLMAWVDEDGDERRALRGALAVSSAVESVTLVFQDATLVMKALDYKRADESTTCVFDAPTMPLEGTVAILEESDDDDDDYLPFEPPDDNEPPYDEPPDDDDDLLRPFYSQTTQRLKRRLALECVDHALAARGLYALKLIKPRRAAVGAFLQIDIPKHTAGMALVNVRTRTLVAACVYSRPTGRLLAEKTGAYARELALVLQLQPVQGLRGQGAGGEPSTLAYHLDDPELFEQVITASEREAFLAECKVTAGAGLCSR